jgi:hypothetical protein
MSLIAFGAAVVGSSDASSAAAEAAARARSLLGAAQPVFAIVFASVSYDRLDGVPAAIEKVVGRLPIAGGTAGHVVFNQEGVTTRGVLVALVGGDGVRATTATARIASPELIDVVPAGAQLLMNADAASEEGFGEALCLAFAPGVDGEALVAAVRKGTAARMQLAGGVIGDGLTVDRPRIFADGGAHADRVQLMGVFTRTPVGVAARHGWRTVGPTRVVTRSSGPWLLALDGRRAVDAWLADVRAANGRPASGDVGPGVPGGWGLGLDLPSHNEPRVRALVHSSAALQNDGAVLLSGAIPEGTRVRVVRASKADLLDAARAAASIARKRLDGEPSGALLLACSTRFAALGEGFGEEPAAVTEALGAPVAGTCVSGEFARAHREIDAFHNATAVVVAWPR